MVSWHGIARIFPLALALGTSALAACVGTVGDGSGWGSSGGGGGGPKGSGAGPGGAGDDGGGAGGDASSGASQPASATLQRLLSDEYAAAVSAALGLKSLPTLQLPADSFNESGFSAPGNMTEQDVTALLAASEQITATLTDADYARISGCDPSAKGEDACVDALIAALAPRAYRRPILDDERADLRGVYDARKAAGDVYQDRVRLVADTILDAPGFLYRTEALGDSLATENGLVKRGAYELASQLSFFLTGAPPDDTLWQAARANALDTADKIAAEARRLLATPAARQTVRTFATQWLGIDAVLSIPKDPTLFPQFDADTRAAMHEETLSFMTYVIFDGDQSWTTLMTAPFSFVNAKLAPIYNLTGVTGTTLQKHDLDPNQRFGLLTQGAVLASLASPSEENPVKRGKLIEERFLCNDVSPPPMAFTPPADPPGQTLTVRQRFETIHQQAGCAGCHNVLDPPGFAFGNYNAVGWFQTTESGLPIDPSGTALLASGGTLPFKDAHGFVQAIAGSDEARSCFAKQWFRYALGRRETAGEASVIASIVGAFQTSNFNVQSLLVAIATSTSFRYHAP